MKDQKLKDLTDEKGNLISPILNEETKNYLIDIDGTITEDVPNEEPERMATCLPFTDALETLNKWYEEGHIITFSPVDLNFPPLDNVQASQPSWMRT